MAIYDYALSPAQVAHHDQAGTGATLATTSYGYDKLYRLTSVTGPSGATSYGYDPVGNRLSKNTTSYTYDRADRILTAGTMSYTVNANGNLVARGADSFGYDQANRLKSATVSGTSSSYVYDGDGKRASKTVGSATTSYSYDVNASLPNVLTDGTLKYVYGLEPAYAVDGAGNVQLYHTDGLGSVRAITDGNGDVIQTYQTDEFGVPVQTQGSSSQPFQYTGQQSDAESGLYDLRARIYDPGIGRFLSRDAHFGTTVDPLSLNRYVYALDDPALLVDPSGLDAGRVGRNGATDNPCFTTFGGKLSADVVTILCLNIQMGVQVPVPVLTPLGPALVPGVLPFSPTGDPGDDWAGGIQAAERHFADHGAEFRAATVGEYTQKALSFIERAVREKLPGQIDVDGTIRMYDRRTNTLVSYVQREGVNKLVTLFKPDRGIEYFRSLPGRSFYGTP